MVGSGGRARSDPGPIARRQERKYFKLKKELCVFVCVLVFGATSLNLLQIYTKKPVQGPLTEKDQS
jgi:hypothetical protein